MTAKEARALIESGNNLVRHSNKGSFRHWGHGFLIGVEGEYAIIRPGKRHRTTERIPLDRVKPWKSRNMAKV